MNIEQLRAAYDAAVQALHDARANVDGVGQRIAAAGEGDDVDVLNAELNDAAAAFDDAVTEADRCKGNLEDAVRRQAALDAHPTAARPATPARTTHEPPVYGPGSTEGRSFFADAYHFQFNASPEARERLERHGRQNVEAMQRAAEREAQRQRTIQERVGVPEGVDVGGSYQFRDVGTGAFAGLTVPQYLVDMYAPLARAGAPMLNMIARKLPLPGSGMTLNISRITTGTAVAEQASENGGVQETDMDDTLLTVNVNTYAGQQDVSRQALERSELVDAVVFGDLILAYFTKIDGHLINGSGSSGQHLGVRNVSGIIAVTYTDASPTVPELYPKGSDAVQQINANVFAPATAWLMHPRRWGWQEAALDSQSRPLVATDAGVAFNPIAVGEAAAYGQVVGKWHGLPVVTDGNILTTVGAGTNQDTILGVSGYNLLYWQEGDGMPRQFRFEQANAPQSIRLAVWGYSAFSAGRYPGASAAIDGTGLTAPTF